MTDCIEFQGALNPTGYGRIGTRKFGTRLAHRAKWVEHCGEIPNGLYVLHKCDNPKCVNIDHLFLGTAADNSMDMVLKNRAYKPKGSLHPKAKLTEEDVHRIRDLYEFDNMTQVDLAHQFGVSQVEISHIILRRHWRHI